MVKTTTVKTSIQAIGYKRTHWTSAGQNWRTDSFTPVFFYSIQHEANDPGHSKFVVMSDCDVK